MAKQKTIIFDIDGTAINSPAQKVPTPRLIQATKNLQDSYFVCAATGRCWSYAKPVLKGLDLEDLCIISGGTQICNPKTGEIVWQKDIDPQALKEVVSIFMKNGTQKLIFNDYTEDDYFHAGTFPNDFDVTQKVNWLSQSFVPDELAVKMQPELSAVRGVTCVMVVSQKPGCRDMHIVNEQATKEHAITELLSRLGVDRQDTIGIGDGHNDIDLFTAVNTKVAVANAVDSLKTAADVIIGDVKEDGLAAYFEQLHN